MAAKHYILALLLIPFSASADEWTGKDTAWQAVYTVMHVADWGQTLDIAESCTDYAAGNFKWRGCEYTEANPFLGERPSRREVNTYFASTLIAHTLIAYYLPTEYRRIWQTIWIGIEADQVARNAKVGVDIRF